MSTDVIPFNKPFHPEGTHQRVLESLNSGHTAGDGPQTRMVASRLQLMFAGADVLLTPSCTHALEMAVRLLQPEPGDEIIVPSYTFTSTANAIILGGATPVFVDIEPETQNIDLSLVEEAVGPKTIAVFCINYAGIAPQILKLRDLCDRNGLILLEDNAHGLGASVSGRVLGTIGTMATQSFHETKNVQCGEGGCLVLNDHELLERAEILREKGTDRSRFFRGQVDKYTWVSEGSSWLLADTLAAVLGSQLDDMSMIQGDRHRTWSRYHESIRPWAEIHGASVMVVPGECVQPSHMFYVMMPSLAARTALTAHLRDRGVTAAFHYQPLHSSRAGVKFGRTSGSFPNTVRAADQLLRLPLWVGMTTEEVERVIEAVITFRVNQ